MAKNTGHGSRYGVVTRPIQAKTASGGTWVKRNSSTGQFLEAKKSGGSFKVARKEK